MSKTRAAWTTEMDDALRALYPSAPIHDLLTAFPGRTRVAIYQRAIRFGLKRWNQGNKPAGDVALGKATPFEIGYAAGFVDGEGTLQLWFKRRHRRPESVYFQPALRVVNTDEASMKLMHRLLGGHYCKARKSKKNLKEVWAVVVLGVEQLRRLLTVLRPHLIVKATRADLLLEYIQVRQSKRAKAGYDEREFQIWKEFYRGRGAVSRSSRLSEIHANPEPAALLRKQRSKAASCL